LKINLIRKYLSPYFLIASNYVFLQEQFMENSENLKLPYIMPSQAQKHVTHNEAIRALDALVQISVENNEALEPPVTPDAGSRYIVPENATGEWTDKSNQIAAYQDGAWAYFKPQTGWLAWLSSQNTLLVFKEGAWSPLTNDASIVDETDKLGINTTADDNSRLSVSANNSLFTHDGTDHRITVNKAQAADTGSVIFQTNWSGRAEMGLAGSNDFSVKVTPDGESWKNALIVSAENGKVDFPQGIINPPLAGTPENLNSMEILYLDAVAGDDQNDGKTVATAIKSLQRLEELFFLGARFQVRLLSDLVWDHALLINFPVAKLEIMGRKSDNSGYEQRSIRVVDSTNISNYPGSLVMTCVSSIFLRSVDISLETSKGFAFLYFSSTMGYLRTYSLSLSRSGSGNCSFFADGSSFVASRHQLLSIDPSAEGYVAQGVAAGSDPNEMWQYTSNITAF
jgi:hypothetical protein